MSEAAGRAIRGWRREGLTTLPTAGSAGGTHYTNRGEVASLPSKIGGGLITLMKGR